MAKLRITWKRSTIGRPPIQERIIKALGFHRLNETVYHDDTPQIRGMVDKISHLLEWSVED
ncbi:50S ribosomal protein L30 [Synergistes jonesii]|uniref:50S ribosomal protein L30 n=1 Tax=Synergistes jonesii TaxID=2754 RepID=A0A073ITM8_9BACT|nr:50S ribosomal protein L30 [Synergistes jonesii]KEJ93114.1 50S ribosomal protein L30 [Synergistes jonesii]MDY2984198.1 50S ribosomal protein L30 [Synergistes jonesii]OFB60761.1 50S ribosomal protein L30 [Synergistes jonesii]OFB64742.1 50S ribosomal protein L30 [Synergistes jonesii]OFB66043.1 50S ribosomal protein L30 [Synergistes jonesii]